MQYIAIEIKHYTLIYTDEGKKILDTDLRG